MTMRLSVRTTHNLLVPAWIATFGFAVLIAPPLGVAASVSVFVVGVVVVPVLLMFPDPPRAFVNIGPRPGSPNV